LFLILIREIGKNVLKNKKMHQKVKNGIKSIKFAKNAKNIPTHFCDQYTENLKHICNSEASRKKSQKKDVNALKSEHWLLYKIK